MSRLVSLDCYRQRVVQESEVEAVCLDEEDGRGALAIQVWGRFAQMHRCDYYKVARTGSAKSLILIEKTDFAKSASQALERFEGALDEFSRELYRTDLRALHRHGTEGLPYQMFWEFIFRKLCEEHAAKAQATMIILEKFHQTGIDKELASCFDGYAKIHYMLLIPNESNEALSEAGLGDNRMMHDYIVDMMISRMASTLVSPNCFVLSTEGEFEGVIREITKH